LKYEVIVGLEVHVELLTQTKLFCDCPNAFTVKPNQHICEVCLGFPGALPQLNAKAVELALKASLALNCQITRYSWFDRKNYFYPDIPKGYQISQYYKPLGSQGFMEIKNDKGESKYIGIARIHLEEDAGKLVHSQSGKYSLVDYNRAGVPLIEIVSEPELNSPAEARQYLENLKSILQYSRVSDCKMEEGSLRCDANISLRHHGSVEFGEKVELKNMNSFKAVEKALTFEVKRQSKVIDKGEKISAQTRRWEEDKEKTVAMRGKLESHDYRCFVDNELAPIHLIEEDISKAKKELPEMAADRLKKYLNEFCLPAYDAEVLTSSVDISDFFEATLDYYYSPKKVSNWIMSEFLMHLNAEGKNPWETGLTPGHLGELVKLVEEGSISGKIGKEVLEKSYGTGESPKKIVEQEGMTQISDEEQLTKIIEQVIKDNPGPAEDYINGKKKALGFLVGEVMKKTSGKANPQIVNKLLRESLE